MLENFNINNFSKIVFLTGAGISAESGLSTFRDSDGLWEKFPIEEVATPQAWKFDPIKVWTFYSQRKEQAYKCSPNSGHHLLSKMINSDPQNKTLITQNIDFLHERSLNHLNIYHMHGRTFESICSKCNKSYWDFNLYFDFNSNPIREVLNPFSIANEQLKNCEFKRNSDGLPLSACCNDLIRPDIVWFGEMPKFTIDIQEKLGTADLFVTIGTSGNVYPAAGFLESAKYYGATTLCINKEEILQQDKVDYFFKGSASEGLLALSSP